MFLLHKRLSWLLRLHMDAFVMLADPFAAHLTVPHFFHCWVPGAFARLNVPSMHRSTAVFLEACLSIRTRNERGVLMTCWQSEKRDEHV